MFSISVRDTDTNLMVREIHKHFFFSFSRQFLLEKQEESKNKTMSSRHKHKGSRSSRQHGNTVAVDDFFVCLFVVFFYRATLTSC